MKNDTKLKIVSWNVNGIRAICKKFKSLDKLLTHFDADLLCLQETKLTKNELTADLALSANWDSYFSFSGLRTGYSGVSTFCRKSNWLPHSAFSSFGDLIKAEDIPVEHSDVSWIDIDDIDTEGRCLVTRHGEFFLFNIYAHALTSEAQFAERMEYKVKWFELLHLCVRELTQRGFKVVVVGDFNCALYEIDHCDPDDVFYRRLDRTVLLKMMSDNGGPCHDIFRRHHPTKKEAFTCWNQSTRARVNNYGTRIDLILVADRADGDFHKNFAESGIMSDVQGSDHAPVWCCAIIPLPEWTKPYRPPPLCSQFLFQGKQKTLDAFLVASHERTSVPGVAAKKKTSKKRKLAQQSTLTSFFAPSNSSASCARDTEDILFDDDAVHKAHVKSKGLRGPWKEFFTKQGPPLCNGHQEPCVMRHVKKSGANKGKRFYVCARPDGPHPIGRCDHFQWEK